MLSRVAITVFSVVTVFIVLFYTDYLSQHCACPPTPKRKQRNCTNFSAEAQSKAELSVTVDKYNKEIVRENGTKSTEKKECNWRQGNTFKLEGKCLTLG